MSKSKKYIICVISVFFCIIDLYGHNVVLSGNVITNNNEKIQEATVVIYDKNGKVISYAFTDKDGRFSLDFFLEKNYIITISYIGYDKITESIDDYKFSNNLFSKDFIITPNTLLAEIIIKPENIEPDTVNLDFSRLKLIDSDKLGDMLKKNPNFKIDDDGSIIYKGKSIDRILINGKETFNYQNSIALDKIENRMISKLQVINNYQDNFSLDKEAPDETVININSKENFKNVYTGSIEGGYGFNDKYNFNSSLMRFSAQFNGFLTNNTNNTGYYTFKMREIDNLFGSKKMMSSIFAESLNELFVSDDMSKNFTSNSNFTFRKHTSRTRINSIIYYINSDRLNDVETSSSYADGSKIAFNNQNKKYKSNAFFANNSFDFLLTGNQLLTFSLDGNYLNKKNSSHVINELFNELAQTELIENNLINNAINRSISSGLTYTNVTSTKGLFSIGSSVYHENIDTDNKIFDLIANEADFNQNYKYKKLSFDIIALYRYKIANGLNVTLKGKYENNNESLNEFSINEHKRNLNTSEIELIFSGKKILKKIDYNLSIAYQNNAIEYLGNNKTIHFVPYSMGFIYESRLNRIHFDSYYKSLVNSIETGSSLLKANNILLIGNDRNPLNNATIQYTSLGYTYDNIFLGNSLRAYLSFKKIENQIKDGYHGIDDLGIYQYHLLESPSSEEYKISITGAKNLFKFTLFPIVADISLSYSYIKSPIYMNNSFISSKTDQITTNFRLQSISSYNLNFESNVRFIPNKTKLLDEILKARYFKSNFKLIYKTNKIKSEMTYSFYLDKVIDNKYKRQSLDFLAEYKIKKITLGVEGKNIDQLLDLFNNSSYNTKYTVLNGINQISILNEAISYFIFKMKYNF